ncbi:MAG: DUF2784 domain-containing protein [Burkholderiales bacterium]|nr:DUF2784 domain-containing protein [Burkholderiales bacterium]
MLLADLVLVLHFAIALFITGSLPLIWLGAARGWRWVRHFGFRALHLFAILVVSAEALAGIWCPLTLLEDALRGAASERSFIARWIHALLFYDLPLWVFTAAYLVFAVMVALTWWQVPPHRKR